MENKTFYDRVIEDKNKYRSFEEAAIDHLLMAHSHLFEEFHGRDCDYILSDITRVIININNFFHPETLIHQDTPINELPKLVTDKE